MFAKSPSLQDCTAVVLTTLFADGVSMPSSRVLGVSPGLVSMCRMTFTDAFRFTGEYIQAFASLTIGNAYITHVRTYQESDRVCRLTFIDLPRTRTQASDIPVHVTPYLKIPSYQRQATHRAYLRPISQPQNLGFGQQVIRRGPCNQPALNFGADALRNGNAPPR